MILTPYLTAKVKPLRNALDTLRMFRCSVVICHCDPPSGGWGALHLKSGSGVGAVPFKGQPLVPFRVDLPEFLAALQDVQGFERLAVEHGRQPRLHVISEHDLQILEVLR